jgi:hypothetical protein
MHLGCYTTTWLLLTEATTPILHLRWLLSKLKMRETLLYMIVGWTLFFGFLVFRVILISMVLWITATQHMKKILEYPITFVVFGYANVAGLLLLNLYWFAIIISRGLKTLQKEPNQSKKKN